MQDDPAVKAASRKRCNAAWRGKLGNLIKHRYGNHYLPDNDEGRAMLVAFLRCQLSADGAKEHAPWLTDDVVTAPRPPCTHVPARARENIEELAAAQAAALHFQARIVVRMKAAGSALRLVGRHTVTRRALPLFPPRRLVDNERAPLQPALCCCK